jgi:hypothetical protein
VGNRLRILPIFDVLAGNAKRRHAYDGTATSVGEKDGRCGWNPIALG